MLNIILKCFKTKNPLVNVSSTAVIFLAAVYLDVSAAEGIATAITAFLFILAVPHCGWALKILESSFMSKINHLSFTIYLLHFPFMLSIGIYLFLGLLRLFDYPVAFCILFVLLTVFTLTFCGSYYYLIERRLDALVGIICKKNRSVIGNIWSA